MAKVSRKAMEAAKKPVPRLDNLTEKQLELTTGAMKELRKAMRHLATAEALLETALTFDCGDVVTQRKLEHELNCVASRRKETLKTLNHLEARLPQS